MAVRDVYLKIETMQGYCPVRADDTPGFWPGVELPAITPLVRR
jgi:hypothetical protein